MIEPVRGNIVVIKGERDKGYVCFNKDSAVTVLVRIFNVFVELTKKPQRIFEL